MTVDADLPERWEQQPGETDLAFAGFQAYSARATSNRSIRKTANDYYREKNNGTDATAAQIRQFGQWSSDWSWPSRSAAYDRNVEAEARRAHLTEVIAMRTRHAQMASALANRVMARILGDEANGIAPIDVNRLGPADLAKWMDTAVRLERLSRGEPDSIVGQQESEAATSQQETARRVLSDPRLRELAAALLDEPEPEPVELEPDDVDVG